MPVSDLPKRKNHRLRGFDYGGIGYYFVTVCTFNKEELLAKISFPSSIIPSVIGEKVIECWNNIEILNANIEVEDFVLMPNHIHGIIIIKNTEQPVKTERKYSFEIPENKECRSLQGLIKDFKSVTTRYYKKLCQTEKSLWQASFYDEVIRNREHYERIKKYIDENPQKWSDDYLYNPS